MKKGKRTRAKKYSALKNVLQKSAVLQECRFQQEEGMGRDGYQKNEEGFPGGAVVENLPANAGNMGSRPGLGRSHMPQSKWAREPQLLSLRI